MSACQVNFIVSETYYLSVFELPIIKFALIFLKDCDCKKVYHFFDSFSGTRFFYNQLQFLRVEV